jgi:hypothetical protein
MIVLNLTEQRGVTFEARFLNPRTGECGETILKNGGDVAKFRLPDDEDWVLHVIRSSPKKRAKGA